MAEDKDTLDAALDGLSNWYEKALADGAGFKSDAERQAYVDSLGDLEKHPMFAQSSEDLEGHPLVEAIRAIKEEDKTLVELALMYKDEGNEWMKKKDNKSLSEAHVRYSHSLTYLAKAEAARKEKAEDPKDAAVDLLQLKSQILSNRAAASLALHNYGSCKRDCAEALAAWPGNIKAHYRNCKALLSLREFEACERACDAGLAVDPENKDLVSLRQKATAERQALLGKQLTSYDSKYQDLKNHWLKVWKLAQSVGVSLGCSLLNEPMQLRDAWPKQGEQGISWPLLVLYPQYNQFDVVPDVNIDGMLAEQLAVMFPDFEDGQAPAPWDQHGEYELSRLVVYLQLHTAEAALDRQQWIESCLENYLRMQSGSIEVVRYALKQLAGGVGAHSVYGEIDALTLDSFNEIVDRRMAERAALLAQKQASVDKVEGGMGGIVEVHLGCTIRRILSFEKTANVLPRGVLSLIAFPRNNSAHKKFLAAMKTEKKKIAILNPI